MKIIFDRFEIKIMGLYKITAKKTGSWGGKRMEKGMSVEIVSHNNPLGPSKEKEATRQALYNKYGIDFKNLISSTYWEVTKIN
ncbi:DUF6140 family protein [Maribacter sp. TH_r10]|uniref:DUF6140 family protein n=1 Tax=Maribacter sp. TH_r10 TaxID=3082086 RepID=UPI0029554E87|nr:DUF6140 family protein [Maribacter sp. TH_r10]MDV7138234.1 DUF6140 family protein [Maribacter sp. TH_r10]